VFLFSSYYSVVLLVEFLIFYYILLLRLYYYSDIFPNKRLMNIYSPCLKILSEREGKGAEGNISPSFPPIPLILFTPKMRGKRRGGKILNCSPPFPPFSLTTYPNKVSTNHLLLLPFPSITILSLPLTSSSLFRSKQCREDRFMSVIGDS